MEVLYTKSFIKSYDALPSSLKSEIKEKIILFCDTKNHNTLHVHKLHGHLKEQYSFYVNYTFRIVFIYTNDKPKKAILLAVGRHEVYNR